MDVQELILLADLNYIEAMRDQTRAGAGTIIEEDGMCLMMGSDSHPILNVAVRLDPQAEAGECIEVAQGLFDAGRHGYTLILRNSTDDSDLKATATRAGLVSLLSPPEMILYSPIDESPLPDGVEVREVRDDGGITDFVSVAGDAWTTYGIPPDVTSKALGGKWLHGAPHVRAVVTYYEGNPSSCALVHASHGIAGVFWVSTAGDARGKGLGEISTRAVSNLGFDLGARLVSLQASPMGESIYRKMGYEQIAKYELLASLGPQN